MFTHGTSGFYLRPVKISFPDTSSMPRYRKCTKTTCFSIIRFFRTRVKLGFEFHEVLTIQKSWCSSLKFNFYEEKNPMLGSLKNYSFVESPNFPHQTWKCSESNFALTERCTFQWRVSVAFFCWSIMDRDPKKKKKP